MRSSSDSITLFFAFACLGFLEGLTSTIIKITIRITIPIIKYKFRSDSDSVCSYKLTLNNVPEDTSVLVCNIFSSKVTLNVLVFLIISFLNISLFLLIL